MGSGSWRSETADAKEENKGLRAKESVEPAVRSNVEMVRENATGCAKMKQREGKKTQNPKRHF